MNLYLLRHASAGTRRLNPLLDAKRPLDKEGKQHCLHLAYLLNALKISFDLVISSPLKRALQTAQFVATETGYEAKVRLSGALAPEATFADFQHLLADTPGKENVLVVGHSPNIQLFLGALLIPADVAAETGNVPRIRMRKGSISRVSIARGSAMLQSLIDPRLVRTLYATSTTSSRRKISRK